MSVLSPDKCTFYPPVPDVTIKTIPCPPPAPLSVSIPAHRGHSCGANIHYFNKNNPAMQKVFATFCGRWNCSVCGPKIKKNWTQHLISKAVESDGEIHQKTITKAEWTAYSQIIRRNKKQYVKIERSDGYLNIFTTCAVESGKALSTDEAKRQIENAVRVATFEHRAISTSRAWSMTVKKTEPAIWQKVQSLPSSMEDVKKTLKYIGLNQNILSVTENSIIWMMPEEWMNNEEAKLNTCNWLLKVWDTE